MARILWRAARVASLCACLVAFAGCITDPIGARYALENTQRQYTNLVRWGEIEKASVFVDPEKMEAFLEVVSNFETIRVTDYDAGDLVYSDQRMRATIDVTYHAYDIRNLLEKKIETRQEWYRDERLGLSWRVRPQVQLIAEAFVDDQG